MLHVYGLGKRLFRINQPYYGYPICQAPKEENEIHFIANCRDKDFDRKPNCVHLLLTLKNRVLRSYLWYILL